MNFKDIFGTQKLVFKKFLHISGYMVDCPYAMSPNYWGNIELLCENYTNDGLNLYWATHNGIPDEGESNGCLFLGKLELVNE